MCLCDVWMHGCVIVGLSFCRYFIDSLSLFISILWFYFQPSTTIAIHTKILPTYLIKKSSFLTAKINSCVILDGNSEKGAYVRNNPCHLIYSRHLIRSWACTYWISGNTENIYFLYACTRCSKIPSNIITMGSMTICFCVTK